MTTPAPILPANQPAAKTWSSGGSGYDLISRQIADAIEHCVDRLAPSPGEHILDVATGTGWTARRIGARGARVIGVDFAEEVIEFAANHPESALGTMEFQVADAESLPFADGTFDAVTSTFGVMFCRDPERAAAELAPVCKPGGRIALATWATEGGIHDLFKVIKGFHPPAVGAPPPSPFEWGDTERLHELLGASFTIASETATSVYRASSPEQSWAEFSTGYGPIVTLLEKLSEQDGERFRLEFEALHASHASDLGVLIERPYVITAGRRRA